METFRSDCKNKGQISSLFSTNSFRLSASTQRKVWQNHMSMGRLTELQFYTLENVPLKMNGCAISQFFFLFFFLVCESFLPLFWEWNRSWHGKCVLAYCSTGMRQATRLAERFIIDHHTLLTTPNFNHGFFKYLPYTYIDEWKDKFGYSLTATTLLHRLHWSLQLHHGVWVF